MLTQHSDIALEELMEYSAMYSALVAASGLLSITAYTTGNILACIGFGVCFVVLLVASVKSLWRLGKHWHYLKRIGR